MRLGGGKALTTAEGQTVLIVVLSNPLAEDIQAVRLGHAIELNGHRNGMRRKVVGVLAAAILFSAKAAIRSNNPVLFFENKLLYTAIGPVPEEEYIVPIGMAEVKHAGTGVTLVALGAMVVPALEAAEALAGEGISVEVVDPRTLVPCDWATIVRSVVKIGRLVVAEPGSLMHGFGAEVVTRVAEATLGTLKAPPRRVAEADVPIPYNRALENAALPDVEGIVRAVQAILGEA